MGPLLERSSPTLGVLAAIVIAGAGCGAAAFACEGDPSCQSGAGDGKCEPTGACSFPDPRCPSGRRYGEHAAGGLAGQCVPDDVAGTETDTTSPTNTGGPITTTSVATTDLDTGRDTETSIDPSASETTAVTTAPATSGAATTGSVDESSGGATADAYSQCSDAECNDASQCEPLGALPQTCAPPCITKDDCPAPIGSAIQPECVGAQGPQSWCVLPCVGSEQCPAGMECSDWEQQQFGMLCTWF